MKEKGHLASKIIIGLLVLIHLACEINATAHTFLKGGYLKANGECKKAERVLIYKQNHYFSAVTHEPVDDVDPYKTVIKTNSEDKDIDASDGIEIEYVYGQFLFHGRHTLDGEYWRLLTGGLLHNDFLHLILNCYFLWRLMPMTITLYGWKKAQLTLWLSVIGGALVSGIELDEYGLGISGGVLGLYALYFLTLLCLRRHGVGREIDKGIQWVVISLVALFAIGLSIDGISNLGHIGGLVTGLVLGLIYLKGLKKLPSYYL